MAEVPPLAETTISTVPAVCAGDTAVMDVGELTVNEPAFVPPNVNPVTLLNPVPVMVTLAPPEPDPVLGETPVMVGAVDVNEY